MQHASPIPHVDLASYFERIGFRGAGEVSLSTLEQLHLLHPATIAFENMDVLLRLPIRLDLGSLQSKLVGRRRGGYCYEHNTLFQSVLETIGFSVTPLGAKVQWRYPEGTHRPRSHMVLRIRLPEGDYLADVGFGLLTLTAPLRLEADAVQTTPHGEYRLTTVGQELRVDARSSKDWAAVYQISLQEQPAPDWEVYNWYTSTHPDSRFTRELMVARAVDRRRYGLLDNKLSIYNSDGTSQHETLESQEALETILRDTFNIEAPDAFRAWTASLWDRSA